MSAASIRFTELMEASKATSEHNDCTVKALAAATRRSYSDCHAAMKQNGRRNRCGSHLSVMQKAAKTLGFQMTKQDRDTYSAKTCRSAGRDRRLAAMGSIILATSSHVAAMVDGDIIDWTSNRLHRIVAVYTIMADRTLDPKPQAKLPPIKRMTTFDQRSMF